MTSLLKSLRKRVWSSNNGQLRPDETGEALRDIHGFCERLTLCSVTEVKGVVWSEPFSIALELRPSIVILADARQAGTLTAVDTGPIDWSVESISTGGKCRASIKRAATLKPSQLYDLKFLVVY